MSKHTIKGILFDAGGILITINYEFLARNLQIIAETDKTFSIKYGPLPQWKDFETGEHLARPELDEFVADKSSENTNTRLKFLSLIWESAWRETGATDIPSSTDSIFLKWAQRIEEQHIAENLWQRVIPGTGDALKTLSTLGLTMAVVSNADGRVEEILEKNNLRKYFSVVVDSHIENVEKPDPEIFRRSLSRLNLKANETLYLGDFYSIDVIGARRAGMGAVLMDPRNIWEKSDVPKVTSLKEYYHYLSTFNPNERPSPWKDI